MKRYLNIMAFAMLAVFSLAIVSCSSDDDDDENWDGGTKAKKTLVINGVSYYANYSGVSQSRNGGRMLIHVWPGDDPLYPWQGRGLGITIPPSKVSQLSVGQVFDSDDISIDYYGITSDGSHWNLLSGSITIKSINSTELTIEIVNMKIQNSNTYREITISGTATCTNSTRYNNGDPMPFDEV